MLRKLTVGLFLFTPIVLYHAGPDRTFLYVALLMGTFALFRAVAETAHFPWLQEVVPTAIRGKFSAVQSIVTMLVGFLTVTFAGYVMGLPGGLNRFMILMGVGVAFGFVSASCAFPIPREPARERIEITHLKSMQLALRDRNFRLFLCVIGLTTLGSMIFTFIPLFMKEQVGLSDRQVVLLQVGVYAGTLVSSFPWGWTADRYGSKPVTVSSLLLLALLSFFCLLLPRQNASSYFLAMALSFFRGIAAAGSGIGSIRLLYVNVVPPERKTEYMSIYYAWVGIVGGITSLFSGRLLDFTQELSSRFLIFYIDAYTPLFISCFLVFSAGSLFLMRLKADSELSPGKFMGLFFLGNPFQAIRSLIHFRLAWEERHRVKTAQRWQRALSAFYARFVQNSSHCLLSAPGPALLRF